ncbi:MAG: hypothetical protein COV44_07940 [Deltaproteobacteria bacterium CG11_big_fil_rev_8_21_14_0_20_45_16]|nr:MAG: hypothetical protein COV44_07940 [Deltaproteobacteria bacterium CG11_big_fil_rev_8_21_14_0_20_45_16]
MELHSFKNIENSLECGEVLGKIYDVYFDNTSWFVRYVVVDLESGLSKRKVLISPVFIERFSWDPEVVPVRLKAAQIRNAPDWDVEKPISRLYEKEYFEHFHYNPYLDAQSGAPQSVRSDESELGESSNLRSAIEVRNYIIHSTDVNSMRFGHLDDFIFDIETWKIRYLVIHPSNVLNSTKQSLISTKWAGFIDWVRQEINIDLPVSEIRSAPPYDATLPPNHAYANKLHAHYKRELDWNETPVRRIRTSL